MLLHCEAVVMTFELSLELNLYIMILDKTLSAEWYH